MAEARGTVTRCEGEHAFVRIADEGCGRCHEPGGCGGSSLTRAFCSSRRIYRVWNPGGANPGDEVVIAISDRTLLRSAVAGYVLPLLGLFLGAVLGLKCAGEPGSMLGAALGLIAAWGLQRIPRVREFFSGPDAELSGIRRQKSGIGS